MIKQRVLFRTGPTSWGEGTVIDFEAETDILTVQDDEDGSTWTGPLEQTEPLESEHI